MKKIASLLILLTTLATFAQAAPGDSETTAFVGVNVIPMDKERVLQNQIVIVRGGVIAEIGDARKVKIPKARRRLTARKF